MRMLRKLWKIAKPFLRSPRLSVAAVLFLFITCFYAGKVILIAGSWRLWRRVTGLHLTPIQDVPCTFAMHDWLDTLYRFVYVPVMRIEQQVRHVHACRTAPQSHGVFVLELCHGMTVEQFLGLLAGLRQLRVPIKIVVKMELEENPFLTWLFLIPLRLIDGVIVVDRGDGEAAVKAIWDGVRESRQREDIAYVILVDGTRPTASRRRRVPQERRHTGMRRLMPPKQRGPFELTRAVQEIHGGHVERVFVGHGLVRPYDEFEEMHTAMGNLHIAYVSRKLPALPETPEEYGAQLNSRWTILETNLLEDENAHAA